MKQVRYNFTFIEDKHSALTLHNIFLELNVNYIFEIQSYFRYNWMVDINILVAINTFEDLKRSMDLFSRGQKNN